jgi:hypothetical protein
MRSDAYECTRAATAASRRHAPLVILLAASVLFRLPALVNAAGTNSDAAIVGLQAMHILRGEWSWFLYGSGYQTSVDSAVAAAFFTVLGPTPLALMLSAFAGHLTATWLAFATLRRHLPPPSALLCVLPLVFAPAAVHTYALYPPRQAAITLVFASVWLLDRPSTRPALRFALGAATAALACFADPYALVFMPSVALLGALAAFDDRAPRALALSRLAVLSAGAALGALPYVALTHSVAATHGQSTFSAGVLAHNLRLLWDECLPWALSARAWYSPDGAEYVPWEPGGVVRALQIAAAASFVTAIATGGILALRKGSGTWEARRLGAAGASVLPVTIGAFSFSLMVMDAYSMRYLASIVLFSPFALAPLVERLLAKRAALALAPYLVAAAVCGWLGYGRFVDGWRVRTAPGRAEDERALFERLRERGVTRAMADYWVSYRLTFLSREEVFVVPTHAKEDRYLPYRDAFADATVVAYLFDPVRSREAPDSIDAHLRDAGVDFSRAEHLEVGRYTALVAWRR